MKDINNQHPTLPYPVISIFGPLMYCWINVLASSELTLKCLTEKLIALLLILSEPQKQTLLVIDIENVKIYEDKLIIIPNSSLKHTKPKRHLQAIYSTSQIQ